MLVFWTSSNTVPHTTYTSKFLAVAPSETSRRDYSICGFNCSSLPCHTKASSWPSLSFTQAACWGCGVAATPGVVLGPLGIHSYELHLRDPHPTETSLQNCCLHPAWTHQPSKWWLYDGDCCPSPLSVAGGGRCPIHCHSWLARVKVRSWTPKYVPSPFCGVADATTSTLSSFPIPPCMDFHGHRPQAV